MSQQRFEERQREVCESLARLTEVVALPESDVIRDATIQRFEFTFEIVWKTLKLYLEHQGHECGGPRSVFKQAFVEHLIGTPEDADLWHKMLADRNVTSHTYDASLAHCIYYAIRQHHAPLLTQMAATIINLKWN